jgi:MATE family multidrug resistance protein
MVGATFFVADGIQTVAAGALRGMSDTRVPLLFAVISYWLIGFTSAYGLAFWTELGAVGVWIGLSCGTAVYATLLVLRFRLLTHRLQLAMRIPARPTPTQPRNLDVMPRRSSS